MTETKKEQGVCMTVQVAQTGWYCWQLRYSSPGRACYIIWVDGAYEGLARLVDGAEQSFTACPMQLKAGQHEVRVAPMWGEVQQLTVSLLPAEAPVAGEPDFHLSNPNALPVCHRVMALLRTLRGKRMLMGQHINGSDVDVELIERLSGRLPALVGFDMMSFSSACCPKERTSACVNEVANCMGNVERALYWGRDRGALVTLSWHWFSPTDGWDKSFYTEKTKFDLADALRTKDHRYELLLADIDRVAAQLARLQEANIPVLWRPLHEAEGRWFWWGASGPASYIELYRLMYERLTFHHGLNNLIWVWNAPENGWFPGEDVVDIIATDVYAPQANAGEMALEYGRCVEAAENRPYPVALAEAGVAPDPELIRERGLDWMWFMLWCGFTHDPQQNPPERLERILKHPMIVDLEEFKQMMANEADQAASQ